MTFLNTLLKFIQEDKTCKAKDKIKISAAD